jgi:MFS family permease
MQQVAISWMVYRLTNSPFYLGVISFSTQIPIFAITPFAGVLVDKWNRHRILVATQILSMLQALALAILVMKGSIVFWQVVVLSVFLGLINALDMPTRQAFVYELVREEDLPNAIALNSMIFNGARLIGPSIAGLLIAAFGEGVCFLLNSISFLAVLVSLAFIKTSPKKTDGQAGSVLSELKAGLRYAFGSIPIRSILLLLAMFSLVGMAYPVLMPVFARDILGKGPRTLGFLMGSIGVGALSGAVFLARRETIHGLGRIIVLALGIFGAAVLVFSFSHTLWFSLIIIFWAGFGAMVLMASINTILQTIVEDNKRGRIMSLYTMAFMGMATFGSLLAGSIAAAAGAERTLQASAVLCLFAAVVFAAKLPSIEKVIHPIYARKGILPPIAVSPP